jgi:hypothetical protein
MELVGVGGDGGMAVEGSDFAPPVRDCSTRQA